MKKLTEQEQSLKILDDALSNGKIDDSFIQDIYNYIRAQGSENIPSYVVDMTKFLSSKRSKEENDWAISGKTIVEVFFESKVVFCGYEWQSYKMPGGSYTPDFSYLLADGRWIHIEVKGSKFQHEYKYTRARLRAVASINPWFIFAQAMCQGRSNIWDIEVIKPDDFLVGMVDNA